MAGLVLAVGLVFVAGPVQAQYPPTTGNGRVSRSDLQQCQCTQFTGDGFAPNTGVTITDNGAFVAFVTANGAGHFTVKVCFDENSTEGQHLLEARGTNPSGGEHVARATVQVTGTVCFQPGDEVHPGQGRGNEGGNGGNGGNGGTGGSRGDGLARTGAALVVPGLLVGFTLVATGSLFVFVSRRRRAAVLR